jgi:hypothetical protein
MNLKKVKIQKYTKVKIAPITILKVAKLKNNRIKTFKVLVKICQKISKAHKRGVLINLKI